MTERLSNRLPYKSEMVAFWNLVEYAKQPGPDSWMSAAISHRFTEHVLDCHIMILRARLGWLLILLIVQLLYFPINRLIAGGVGLSIPLDAWIPLVPIWTIPYVLGLAWWAGCYIWAALKMNPTLYYSLVASSLFTMLTAYVFYLLYPTYVTRPVVEGSGWQIDMLRQLYANDRAYNAFPSGHTFTSLLILFYWWIWQPGLRWLWFVIVSLILVSTLLTHQHYLVDLLGGLLWAVMGFFFGLWFSRRPIRS
jgi:membrane-associated phospholipid phosphatase